ncbi:dephospho-CoA kinase [Daejeonella sp.]|uniref:dephospho-CoA kinase n=1 Tax=Daejeonella sp. TaxID=2805397 RepID=UPI0025C47824|nr:dephospho-CoA kinase [Daejeonella sp.]
MIKVGITGGIGSGKTTVCRVFELLGIPVFYADNVAKTIMQTDSQLKNKILNTFGPESYSIDGQLNRPYISSIVFKDQSQLNKLNALVHPAVFRAFDRWIAEQKEVPYILKEAALLYESESYKMCDLSILVISPESTRISRIKARDHISEEEIMLRMKRQFSDEQKMKLANHILINDENRLLIPQILDLHQQFLKISRNYDY